MFLRPQYPVDAGAWRECITDNCYRLPNTWEWQDPILDIGAHIGCFALAALARGATNVHCFEADHRNYIKLAVNMEPFSDRVHCHNMAVWRSDVDVETLPMAIFDGADPNANTGGGSVVSGVGDTKVAAIKLDTIIEQLQRVQFLKIDCEGSEFPILYSSKRLSQVERIAAEVHTHHAFSQGSMVPWKENTVPKLAEYLLSKEGGNFREVQYAPHKTHTFLTVLWALR